MKKIKQWAAMAVATMMAALCAGSALAQIPDIAAGQKRAQVCFSCHGDNGVSKVPGTPHLAGQDRAYLIRALQSYRNGQRLDPTMVAMAKPLSETDLTNIATFFNLVVKNARGETLAAAILANERIKPVGTVVMAEAPAAYAAPRSAEAIYGATCTACHASGSAGAPKLGDKAAWSKRIAQGNDKLYEHAIKGFNAMPVRGSCSDCSDADIKKVVEYMIGKSK